MYKKFLNAILFGALILGSAGTITSCKDYDDEIDEINQKLNNLSSKDELTAQIGQLTGTISAAQAAAAQASTEAANALAAAKEAAAQAEQAAAGAGQATGQAAEAINGAKTAATTAENAAAAAKDAAAKAAKASEDAAKAIAAGADANKALADAKKAADAAAATAKEASDAAAAAKKAADEAAKTAGTAAAKAVADAQVAIADAAKKVAEEAAKAAAADAVALEVKGIKERLDALEKGAGSGSGSIDPKALEEIQKAIEEAKKSVNDIVGKISAAVTSVSIVDSYTAAQVLSSKENIALKVGQGTWANFYYELLAAQKYMDITREMYEIEKEYAAEQGYSIREPWIPLSISNNPLDLDFTAIVEYADWTAAQGWGKWMAEYENENPFDFYGIGANLKNAMTFKKGQQVNRPDYFVVRVSPTNAVITGDMLQLVNSEGKNLNEFLTLEVDKFEGRLSRVADVNVNWDLFKADTRAEDESETGLWIVKATLKSPYDVEKFDELTWFPSDFYMPQRPKQSSGTSTGTFANLVSKATTRSTVNLDNGKEQEEDEPVATLINKILYAVQVNNTAEDAADRYVTSSYDLTFGTSVFQPANRLHFSVNGVRVEKLNNRYCPYSYSFLEGEGREQEYKERVWLPDTVDVKPGIVLNAPKTPADPKQNAEYNWYVYDNVNTQYGVGYEFFDFRSMNDMEAVVVAPGETFTITLDDYQGWATKASGKVVPSNGPGIPVIHRELNEVMKGMSSEAANIKGYECDVKPVPTEYAVKAIYVVLDQPNAVESIPSEWNAWLTYDYTGINEIVEGTSVDITVSGDELVSKRGDIIGFRVYAINWDGTLVDPDGRAFYIRVGEVSDSSAATVIYPTSDQDFIKSVDEESGEITYLQPLEKGYPISDPTEYTFDPKSLKNGDYFTWEATPIKYTKKTRNDIPQYGSGVEAAYSDTLQSMPFFPVFLDAKGMPIQALSFSEGTTGRINTSINSKMTDAVAVVTVPVIPNWLAYVDDKAYSGTLTIYDKYDMVVEKIVITMTKVLPTEAPKGIYSRKTEQFVGDLLQLYLEPDTTYTVALEDTAFNEDGTINIAKSKFKSAADNGIMPIEHILNFDDGSTAHVTALSKNFTVTFAASDTLFKDKNRQEPKLDDNNKVQYTAPAVLTGDSTLTVPAKLIDNKTKHATTVEYNFGQISTKKYVKFNAKTGEGDYYEDYQVEVDKFETEYHDIYDSTYSWRWMNLAEYKKDQNNKDLTQADLDKALKQIKYGAGSTQPGNDPQFTLDLKYIIGESTRDGLYNAPLSAPYEGSLFVYDASLTSDANGLEEYFDVILDGTTLKFVPLDSTNSINYASNPTADVPSTLNIKVVDMYKHTSHVATVKMTVKKR